MFYLWQKVLVLGWVMPWNLSSASHFSNAGDPDISACSVQCAHTYWKQIRKIFSIPSWDIALPFSKFLFVSWMEFLGVSKVLETVNNTAQGLREWTTWSNRLFPSLISVSLWFKDFLHLLAVASLGHFIHCVVILQIMGNGRGYLNPPVAIETQ